MAEFEKVQNKTKSKKLYKITEIEFVVFSVQILVHGS